MRRRVGEEVELRKDSGAAETTHTMPVVGVAAVEKVEEHPMDQLQVEQEVDFLGHRTDCQHLPVAAVAAQKDSSDPPQEEHRRLGVQEQEERPRGEQLQEGRQKGYQHHIQVQVAP